ncbi:hypothetical protein JDV02_004166 [Purpureocillium takamizusanense]|uniref:Uncharacterized protein n=1 Tax=Purpureocillium takamizusanense TaxID=2060973 RepID=A0A9Q8VAJ1_9HYPO|nr:uncharacterized protein JDV02_004166 [Purpureocillium takamizusanense]UNI17852.1 hypothetical protein JDV02_004166 [Purpureocillium takamizusanense]
MPLMRSTGQSFQARPSSAPDACSPVESEPVKLESDASAHGPVKAPSDCRSRCSYADPSPSPAITSRTPVRQGASVTLIVDRPTAIEISGLHGGLLRFVGLE